MAEPLGQADALHDVADQALVRPLSGQLQRQGDVLHDRQRGQQVEGLEDEADPVAAQLGQLGVVQAGEVGAADGDRAGGGLDQSRGAVQEGALAGSGRSHDGGEGAVGEPHGEPAERGHLAVSSAIGLRHGVQPYRLRPAEVV